MQSIFDKETDRRGTGSMKWDVTPEESFFVPIICAFRAL